MAGFDFVLVVIVTSGVHTDFGEGAQKSARSHALRCSYVTACRSSFGNAACISGTLVVDDMQLEAGTIDFDNNYNYIDIV